MSLTSNETQKVSTFHSISMNMYLLSQKADVVILHKHFCDDFHTKHAKNETSNALYPSRSYNLTSSS
jgi:hypothetical protein